MTALPPLERFAVAAWKAITAVLEASHADDLPAIHAALVLDASELAAALIEQHARPPEQYWGPERGEDGGAA